MQPPEQRSGPGRNPARQEMIPSQIPNSGPSLHPIAGAVDELAKHVNGVVVVETSGGRCRECRHPLTAPKSVRLGVGPVCARRADHA